MFNTIVNVCEKHGFLGKIALPKLKLEQFKIGPTGFQLLQNLKNEWHYNIIINKDISVFPCYESFDKTFEFAKNMCLERLPFGIAEIIQHQKIASTNDLISYYNIRIKEKEIHFENLFANEDKVTLKCTVFTSSQDAVQFFHQWQRQRRIWWRKFSPNPGRYKLTDIKTDTSNIQSVQIMAKYPWNSQLVETLTLYPNSKFLGIDERLKEGKKTVRTSSVVSEIDKTTMFLNAICDAYDEPEYKSKKRTLLRFHRKLAPYSISFAITAVGASVVAELNDLALYLTKELRSNHVSTLFLPSSSKLTLESQWKQYDELGIPYNVLLNERTLKDGIAQLRSRDTTLKEQVHVTELVTYVEQLLKNY